MESIVGFTRKCSRPIVAKIWEEIYSRLGYDVEVTYTVVLNLPFLPYMGEPHITVRCAKRLK